VLDLNAVAKGLAIDLAVRELGAAWSISRSKPAVTCM
jgi:hypothetical protein